MLANICSWQLDQMTFSTYLIKTGWLDLGASAVEDTEPELFTLAPLVSKAVEQLRWLPKLACRLACKSWVSSSNCIRRSWAGSWLEARSGLLTVITGGGGVLALAREVGDLSQLVGVGVEQFSSGGDRSLINSFRKNSVSCKNIKSPWHKYLFY